MCVTRGIANIQQGANCAFTDDGLSRGAALVMLHLAPLTQVTAIAVRPVVGMALTSYGVHETG
ncbi:MAG TPA: hypothetical protein VGL99_21920 [Chloroflexota bacterium]|jgi:hypothetical protein